MRIYLILLPATSFPFLKLAASLNVKMSNGIVLSPKNAISKTRNAILRMKKCSPELRTVLRQRCQERIQNDRLKILNKIRKIKLQDSFRIAFGSIICEEWKNIEDDELSDSPSEDLSPVLDTQYFNLDDEILLEEFLEKELLSEHEDWLLQQYEELINEDLENSDEVVCPLCCLGFLKLKEFQNINTAYCSKCSCSFLIEKSLLNLQAAIYECLSWHDKQCDSNPGFISIPKTESDNNLCLICHHCSFLNVIV